MVVRESERSQAVRLAILVPTQTDMATARGETQHYAQCSDMGYQRVLSLREGDSRQYIGSTFERKPVSQV